MIPLDGNIAAIIMVVVGIVLMSASIGGALRLNQDLLPEIHRRWGLMTAFMIFFNAGYIVFVFILLSGINFPIDLLIGLILLGGAVFVFLFIKLSEFTVMRMNDTQRQVEEANEQLSESNKGLALQVREREVISAELRKSKAHLENIFNNSIPLCITNKEQDIVEANDAYYHIFGKAPEGVVQKCYESRPGSTCKTSECPFDRIMAGDLEVVVESKKIDSDGEEYSFLVTARPFMDEQGSIVGIVESFQDITGMKLVEEALAEEKERLLVTLKSIADGVVTVDVRGRVILVNDMAQALTGWKQKDARERELSDILVLLDSKDRKKVLKPVENVLSRTSDEDRGSYAILVAKDGWERRVNYSVSPIHDRKNEIIGAVLVFQDITEKMRVELESARVQKLESIGLLAGGIAHDFNNILAAIMNNLALARLLKDSGSKVLEKIEATEQAVLKAKDLTGQLLTFSKGGAPFKKVISISDLVKDTVEFTLRGSNVRSEMQIDDELWPVEVDSTQMHQVISNLTINADQAMEKGGLIRVEMVNWVVGADEEDLISPGKYVKIVVHDEGAGIKEDCLEKIFDPYFTTKAEGSGLGLATVYSIVNQHGGYVFVGSEKSTGTTFTIYLPVAEVESGLSGMQTGKVEAEITSDKGVGGKILIMDDEKDIREVLGELLELAGFEVVEASDGEQAIKLFKEDEEGFACVIMDLTIPGGMGGKETIERLLQIDSGVKAIVSSGYSNDPVMADYKKYGFQARVAKPYLPEELVATLNSLIGG